MNYKDYVGDGGRLVTSEAVTSGHPDKICDEIADAVLDAILRADPEAHAGVEVCAPADGFVVFGEVGSKSPLPDVVAIARDVIRGIGYDKASGLDPDTVRIDNRIVRQSEEIDGGVSRDDDEDPFDSIGAGDQGMMIGYATDETPELLPLPFVLAHRLAARLEDARVFGVLPWLRPDGKTEVSVRYDDAGTPHVDTVLISAQHDETADLETVGAGLREHVIDPVLDESGIEHAHVHILVNPCGPWHLGGPAADSGLTGRKLGVDKYGGLALDGGGSLVGKDPSKVDRSGAYATRWIARTIIRAGWARRVSVQVAYAIGVPEPVSLSVDTQGTCVDGLTDELITRAVSSAFDLRPAAIIAALNLREPIYGALGARGHFGRPELPWERDDMVKPLRTALVEVLKESDSDSELARTGNRSA